MRVVPPFDLDHACMQVTWRFDQTISVALGSLETAGSHIFRKSSGQRNDSLASPSGEFEPFCINSATNNKCY